MSDWTDRIVNHIPHENAPDKTCHGTNVAVFGAGPAIIGTLLFGPVALGVWFAASRVAATADQIHNNHVEHIAR